MTLSDGDERLDRTRVLRFTECKRSGVDDEGVRHELWALDDPSAVAAVELLVASAPVVVAVAPPPVALPVPQPIAVVAMTPVSSPAT